MKTTLLKMTRILVLVALLGVSCTPENNNGGSGEVTAISLNKTTMNLEKGANEVLTVSFTPANASDKTVTWVSTEPKVATVTDGIVMGVQTGSTEIIAKCGNASAKCVVTVVISATSIVIEPASISLLAGGTRQINVYVYPQNTTDTYEVFSSDNTIATVEGLTVKGIAEGTAKITAKAGEQTAECSVTVTPAVPDGAVNMGGSIYWAECNLGATKPEEFGDFYAWGETEPYYERLGSTHINSYGKLIDVTWKDGKSGYIWASYKWSNDDGTKFTKYCWDGRISYWGGEGVPDNKRELDPEDDAARARLGGKWRMPTLVEWANLLSNNLAQTAYINGVEGVLFTNEKSGNTLFLPYSGIIRSNNTPEWFNHDQIRAVTHYWTSSANPNLPNCAESYSILFRNKNGAEEMLYENNGINDERDILRYIGCAIRPVMDKK